MLLAHLLLGVLLKMHSEASQAILCGDSLLERVKTYHRANNFIGRRFMAFLSTGCKTLAFEFWVCAESKIFAPPSSLFFC